MKGPVAHTTMIPQGAGPVHTKRAWSLRESGFLTAIFTPILALSGLWRRVVVRVDGQWTSGIRQDLMAASSMIQGKYLVDSRKDCR